MRPSALARGVVPALAVAAPLLLAVQCPNPNALPPSGAQLFMSPQANPVALSGDGTRLYVANTTSGTLSVLEAVPPFETLAEIPVGMDPVSVAVRPKVDPGDPAEDELVFVANHVSDTVSVVNARTFAVQQTLQELDADGVPTTDEPVGIAFDGPDRAFVALDHPNQVLEIVAGPGGRFELGARATLTANAPRALAVAGGRLFVAAFESGNQTEFPSCGPADPVDFVRDDPFDEGCLFPLNTSTLLAFATSPNIGGEVIRDRDLPDRDLFVYDTDDLSAPVATVEGVGTLLYGVAAAGSRVWITNTEARNHLDGLAALGNRMFENRLTVVDCAPACGAPVAVDLDANPLGVPVPTPYGVAASGDGSTLVVSVAGSDGRSGLPQDPGTDIPGLVTLDASGNLLGQLRTGAIPQGLALRSGAGGAPQTAFVLNTVEGTLSVVDVSAPAAPVLVATLPVGSDPTPPEVREGRIAFASARASTSGTFSCESCHPNGNIDQVLWTINTVEGPADVPGCDPASEDCPEPRSTMPIRGLRDTLPLHWVGTLADPLPGVFLPEDDGAPDCDLETDGEVGCIRDIVDASLVGVMCDPSDGCAGGGGLGEAEREAMAAFLAAVSYPPPPDRRPDDALSATAMQGVEDFFTDVGGLGAGLGVSTCADSGGGCHALPLTVATNSPLVGRFDAPTVRGLWDRHLLFSNGFLSSEEFLTAQGFDPSGTGMQEFRSLAATFPGFFTLAYGAPVGPTWAFVNEHSTGLPGLTGRQLELNAANHGDPDVGARLAWMETAAQEGRIAAVARIGGTELRFTGGLWTPRRGAGLTGAELRDRAASEDLVYTVTAELPGGMTPGGPDRQPLLFPRLPDPDAPDLPVVAAGASATFTLAQAYVEPDAAVLVDGVRCAACALAVDAPGGEVEVTLAPAPAPAGVHVIQVLNPTGWASNELPIVTQ